MDFTKVCGILVYLVWWIRNRMVFENFVPDWEFELQQIKVSLDCWTKGWCHNFPFSSSDVANNLLVVRNWKNARTGCSSQFGAD